MIDISKNDFHYDDPEYRNMLYILAALGYLAFLIQSTRIVKSFSNKDIISLMIGKKLISLIHALIMFLSVCCYWAFDWDDYSYQLRTILWSFFYILVDSLVHPVKQHISVIIHHVLVGSGELYSIYSGTEWATFYSFTGEIISVFLHLRKMENNNYLKEVWEYGLVLTFLPTRIVLPLIILWKLYYRTTDRIAILYYVGYTVLNMYWGWVIFRKIRKKINRSNTFHKEDIPPCTSS